MHKKNLSVSNQLEFWRSLFVERRKLFAIILVSIALTFFAATYWGGWTTERPSGNVSQGLPPANVAVADAVAITMSPETVLPATIVSLRDSTIASEISGKVLSVVLVGDVVSEGDVLAQIDPQNAQQLVAQRQAELDRLQSLYYYHRDYLERVGGNQNDLGIPEVTIVQLRSNVDTAKAEVARAKATLKAAQSELSRTSIKAPFTGLVVAQSIQHGEFAQVGSPIVRLVDTNNLEVSARVPAAQVQPIEPGRMLEVQSSSGLVKAPLRALVPVGDAVSRTMELRVTLKDSGLLVGSPVRVSLPTAVPRQVIAVPRDAVVLRPGQQYLFVVEDGIASRREVTLGYGQGELIEVIGEVSAGAVVIVRGGERLRDGQSVAVKNIDNEGRTAGSSKTNTEGDGTET